ncbi:DNA starvation/stationary phase protection protein [Citricoccus alkalitolerans]|uniref:DNA starvation/stationary phase protection protein n=1 Tax=Citricoccus alkalitolerans TaxID=246603 RepID=A0ABV8XUU3_9MICC
MAAKDTQAKTAKKTNEISSMYTVPGIEIEDGHRVAEILQMRLHALNDLQLTLKHAHWNVVGPNFIAVHEMLDPQVDVVRGFVDEVAERVATMGLSPQGTPGAITSERTWDDYGLGRADTLAHISALDKVYDGVIADHRNAIDEVGKIDPIAEDLLVGQARELELFQWFLRSFLSSTGGELKHQD